MITFLAMLAWTATWLIIALRLRKHPAKRPTAIVLHACWLLALSLHGASLLHPWLETGILSVDFLSALSAVLWLTGLLLFLTNLKRPLETLGLFVLPFIPLAILSSTLFPYKGMTISLHNGIGIHIFVSLLAYSMLTLAALLAVLLAAQNRQLHNHNPHGLIRTLPPLQDMEALLFTLIQIGMILLTIGMISGAIYLDGLFGKKIAHKTILSIIAWLSFATLLYGHWRHGWRGRIAIRWTLSGFTLLLLAFFGSKFVLEYVMGTT